MRIESAKSSAKSSAVPASPEACINTSFSYLSWTSEVYEVVGRKAMDTLSARAKGYKMQGLMQQLLRQPIASVLETLTDTVKGLPPGTEKRTVVIRDNVAESDPVPSKCKYIDGQWVTEQSTNARQIHKQAIRSAYVSLAKRDADGKDSYSLPAEWQGKELSWEVASGSKDDGFFTISDKEVKAPEPEEIVSVSIEPRCYIGELYQKIRQAMGSDEAFRVIHAAIISLAPSILASIPERRAQQAIEANKANAYRNALKRQSIKDQYATFLSMGMSEATVNLALSSEHGSDWKVVAQIG